MGIEAALFGSASRDGELKTSKAGKQYLRLNIAIGEGEKTTWINATVFDPDAIDNAGRFVKGTRIYLEGRLALDEWIAQDGTPRHGLSILSWHCRLSAIGRNKPRKEQSKVMRQAAPLGGAAFDDEIPFAPEWRG